MHSDRYSQTVALLKIALPLMALGLLSTLFLVSRAVTPTATIPFADAEVQERLTNQQVTGPYFSGTSPEGDQITFIAERLQTPDGTIGANRAEDILVNVDFANGTNLILEADVAELSLAEDLSSLDGNVEIVTSQGIALESERLLITLSKLDITSPGKVHGETTLGTIDAGALHVSAQEGTANPQWLFTNGVKMLYHPPKAKE